jgi:hypothetical protein
MKNRGKINLTIDLLMFLALAFIAGIGFLIKYILPPGRERILKFGENIELVFLGMGRHQWGAIHLVAGFVLIALFVLHIIFHWKVIGSLIRQAVPPFLLRRTLTAVITLLGVVLFLFPFLIRPQKSGNDDFLHRHSRPTTPAGPVSERVVSKLDTPAGIVTVEKAADDIHKIETRRHTENGAVSEKQGDHERQTSLQGRMTIADAARLSGFSTQEVKKRLGVPGTVSDHETIGHLRRIYGFTMEQARAWLEQVHADEKS